MLYKTKSILDILLIAIILEACSEPNSKSNSPTNQTKEESAQLANPASENCIKEGGNILAESAALFKNKYFSDVKIREG